MKRERLKGSSPTAPEEDRELWPHALQVPQPHLKLQATPDRKRFFLKINFPRKV